MAPGRHPVVVNATAPQLLWVRACTSCRASEWPYRGVTVTDGLRVSQLLLLRLNLRVKTERAMRGKGVFIGPAVDQRRHGDEGATSGESPDRGD